jgi:hypothetical protein
MNRLLSWNQSYETITAPLEGAMDMQFDTAASNGHVPLNAITNGTIYGAPSISNGTVHPR